MNINSRHRFEILPRNLNVNLRASVFATNSYFKIKTEIGNTLCSFNNFKVLKRDLFRKLLYHWLQSACKITSDTYWLQTIPTLVKNPEYLCTRKLQMTRKKNMDRKYSCINSIRKQHALIVRRNPLEANFTVTILKRWETAKIIKHWMNLFGSKLGREWGVSKNVMRGGRTRIITD